MAQARWPASTATSGRLVHPCLAVALARWQHAAGPFWAYVCAAPFLSAPTLPEPAITAAARKSGGRGLREALAGPGQAVYVDLPPVAALRAAEWLNARGYYVVPVIQRWCAPRALLAAERLLGLLVGVAPRLVRPKRPAGAVFLLDSERQGRARGRAHRFDNRYTYSENLLPPPELLLREGLACARWVSARGVADDLRRYLDRLRAAGIRVEAGEIGVEPRGGAAAR